MADRAKKISELPAVTSVVGTDLMVAVANASGNGVTSYITVGNLLANSANVQTSYLRSNTTPANATATGVRGEIRYDTSYVYVCTANNVWKRAAISTW